MPCDMTIQWNSTYDMLVCSNEYRAAVDIITGDRTVLFRPSVQSRVTETSEQNTFQHCHGSPKSLNSVTFYTKKGENKLKIINKIPLCGQSATSSFF
jgi:hypothetical protein